MGVEQCSMNGCKRRTRAWPGHVPLVRPAEACSGSPLRFHGIPPSKNKQDKRARKLAEEVSKKRSNAAEVPEGENTIERVAALQQQAAAPYLVLSGKVRPCLV